MMRSFRATSPPLFHTRRVISTSRRERIRTRPCRPPRNRPLLCWHPTSMSRGTAAQVGSFPTPSVRYSRCGIRSICCYVWTEIGRCEYEPWTNERFCRHCENKASQGQRGLHPLRGRSPCVHPYLPRRSARLSAVGEPCGIQRSHRPVPISVYSGLTVSTDHVLVTEAGRYDIVSVENMKGRGMYTEVLAKRSESTVGKG